MSMYRAAAARVGASLEGAREVTAAVEGFRRAGGAVAEGWSPKPGFLYTVVRAISARINQNWDGWPSDELRRAAHTFVGKPVFVNHRNEDPSKARGVVVAARYVEAGDDKFVEVVQEVDAQRFPLLAHEIRTGGLDSVSMGAEAGHTICSACGNRAVDVPEFCDHVRHHKGRVVRGADGRDVLVYEECRDIRFFELSYVFDPADETAVASKVLVASRKATAARSPQRTAGEGPAHGHSDDERRRYFKDHSDRDLIDMDGQINDDHALFGPLWEELMERAKSSPEAAEHVRDMSGNVWTDEGWKNVDYDDDGFGGGHVEDWSPHFARQAKNCQCWDGYERVPGTKPCAKGSCRKCDSHREATRRHADDAFGVDEDNNPDDNVLSIFPSSRGEAGGPPMDVLRGGVGGMPSGGFGGFGRGPGGTKNFAPPAPSQPSQLSGGVPKGEYSNVPGAAPAPGPRRLTDVNDVGPALDAQAGGQPGAGQPAGAGSGAAPWAFGVQAGRRVAAVTLGDLAARAGVSPTVLNGYLDMNYGEDSPLSSDDLAYALEVLEQDPPRRTLRGSLRSAARCPECGESCGVDVEGYGYEEKYQEIPVSDCCAAELDEDDLDGDRADREYDAWKDDQLFDRDFDDRDFDREAAREDWDMSLLGEGYARDLENLKRWPADHDDEGPVPLSELEESEMRRKQARDESPRDADLRRRAERWLKERISEGILAGGWQPADVEERMERFAEREGIDLAASVQARRDNPDVRDHEWQLVRHASRRFAFGETEAPESVDTLRDDSMDDGVDDFQWYIEPPADLRGPDFDEAKRLDREQDEEREGERAGGEGAAPGLEAGPPMIEIRVPVPGAQSWGGQAKYPPQGYELGPPPGMPPEEALQQVAARMRKGGHMGVRMPDGSESPSEEASARYVLEFMRQRGIDQLNVDDENPSPSYQRDFDDEEDLDDAVAWVPPAVIFNPGGNKATSPWNPVIRRQDLEKWLAENKSAVSDAADEDGDDFMGYEGRRRTAKGNCADCDMPMEDYTEFPGPDGPRCMRCYERDAEVQYMTRHMDADTLSRMWGGGPKRRRKGSREASTVYGGAYRSNERRKESAMSLAARGRVASRGRRQHFADDSRNDQGVQEPAFITQTPAAEEVVAPTGDEAKITNTESNLVARVQRGSEQLRRDAAALARLRRMRAAEGVATETADEVNPSLSGTTDQSLKGDFEALQPAAVATQPKDASLKVFKAFDGWLRRTSGRQARQLHPKALTRQAARFCRATGTPPRAMYPAMGYALQEARRVQAGRRVAVDLPAAAPDGRTDVEAPVKNTTDDDAQASQYDVSDYGNNAGDGVANPDLATDSQIWAPGEKTSRKADGVLAVRCAEAYIKAGLEPAESRWRLAALFQTMNRGYVQRDIALLERVAAMRAEDAAQAARRTPGLSRGAGKGFPPGLGAAPRARTAGVARVAANDPVNDAALWI